jgi:hypothetical protein
MSKHCIWQRSQLYGGQLWERSCEPDKTIDLDPTDSELQPFIYCPKCRRKIKIKEVADE